MRDQLISFETAKMAKGHGIYLDSDPGTTYFIYEDDGSVKKCAPHGASNFGVNHPTLGAVYSNSCNAFTQTYLQRYLHKVHNITVWCEWSGSSWSVLVDDRNSKGDITKYNFGEYEAALEWGLMVGLTCLNK